jgi:DNA polymerase-3 subunit delta'
MALRDVIGQDRAIGILLRTIERGRVPSAYLFAGESGIGKKFAALNLAKALNCLKTGSSDELQVKSNGMSGDSELRTMNSEHVDACDACPSCEKINAVTHPDLVMITPEKGEIRVGEIRAVEESLSFKPFEGRRKVVIIDDADSMNPSAANAFLKTLEEPPEESLLILIAAHPDRLQETIRSRCCRINFAPLSPGACREVIGRVPARDRKKKEEGAERRLSLLVRLSMGRPGLVISSDMEKERERFLRLLRSMLHGDSETWADREEMEKWLEMASLLLRDMAVIKIAGGCAGHSSRESTGCDNLLLNPDIEDFVSKMTKTADITGIINSYNEMVFLKSQMGFNLNKAITWNYTASVLKGVMGRDNGE